MTVSPAWTTLTPRRLGRLPDLARLLFASFFLGTGLPNQPTAWLLVTFCTLPPSLTPQHGELSKSHSPPVPDFAISASLGKIAGTTSCMARVTPSMRGYGLWASPCSLFTAPSEKLTIQSPIELIAMQVVWYFARKSWFSAYVSSVGQCVLHKPLQPLI